MSKPDEQLQRSLVIETYRLCQQQHFDIIKWFVLIAMGLLAASVSHLDKPGFVFGSLPARSLYVAIIFFTISVALGIWHVMHRFINNKTQLGLFVHLFSNQDRAGTREFLDEVARIEKESVESEDIATKSAYWHLGLMIVGFIFYLIFRIGSVIYAG